MKNTIILFLSLFIILGLNSCGNNKEEKSGEKNNTEVNLSKDKKEEKEEKVNIRADLENLTKELKQKIAEKLGASTVPFKKVSKDVEKKLSVKEQNLVAKYKEAREQDNTVELKKIQEEIQEIVISYKDELAIIRAEGDLSEGLKEKEKELQTKIRNLRTAIVPLDQDLTSNNRGITGGVASGGKNKE